MAIPFNSQRSENGDNQDNHYLRIENLLKELLTLLRWMPWTSVTGGTYHTDSSIELQRRRARAIEHHHRRAAAANHRNEQHVMEQQQQQQPLPDLVMSCNNPGANAAGKRSAKTLMLQVEVCQNCYNNGGRLKVVAVTKVADKSADHGGARQIDRTTADSSADSDDEAPVVIEGRSKVKKRLMSFFRSSNIESSILTAVLVIIGWKMLNRQ